MEIFEKGIDWLIRLLRLIGGISLVGMMMVTCTDVFIRGAFNKPIFGAEDLVGFLAVMVLACAMPYTHRDGGHVGVDLLVMKLTPRGQAIVDALTSLVSLILFVAICTQMWEYAAELASKNEVSMTIRIPKHPFIYAVAVCFGLLSLVIFADLIRLIGKAVRE